MPGRGQLFGNAQGYKCRMYSIYVPIIFLEKGKRICMKRNMDLSEFIRESLDIHIKKYEHILKISEVVKPG